MRESEDSYFYRGRLFFKPGQFQTTAQEPNWETQLAGAANLVGWIRSSDATESGGVVDTWTDRKTGESVAKIGSPTVVADQIDGQQIIRTNGSDQGWYLPRVDFGAQIHVFKRYEGTSAAFYSPVSDVSNFFGGGIQFQGDGTFRMRNSGTQRFSEDLYGADSDTVDDGAKAFQSYSMKGSGEHFKVNHKELDATGSSSNTTTGTNMLWGFVAEGDLGSQSSWLRMDFVETILFSSSVTDDELANAFAYLEKRYPSIAFTSTYRYAPLEATKHGSNPLINGHSEGFAGPGGQFYPPNIIKEGSTYYVVGKSSSSGVAFTSSDGISFTEDGTYINNYRGGKVVKEGSAFYWFWESSTDGEIKRGTSTTPDGTISGTATCLAKADINSGLSKSYTSVEPYDIIKEGATYYMIGQGLESSSSWGIWYATASSLGGTWTIQSVLLEGTDANDRMTPRDLGLLYGTIVKRNGKYIMILSVGNMVSDITQAVGVYLAISDSLTGAYKVMTSPLLEADTSTSFEKKRNYCPVIVKDQDGEWLTPTNYSGEARIYFGLRGLDSELTAGVDDGARGITGLATVDISLFGWGNYE